MCGGDGKKVTPVPIPNTEVKLLSADCSEGFPFVRVGRCRAIFCFFYCLESLAQLVEHLTFNQRVVGSSPT